MYASGYGVFRLNSPRKNEYAHRMAYEFAKGAIPEGMTIDHLCCVRNCVNPDHLEVVTGSENTRRGAERRTHCKRGHSFDYAYIRPDGYRECGICRNQPRLRGEGTRKEVTPPGLPVATEAASG